MAVIQVYEALGSFEFELLGNVPREILDTIDWFGHIAIIPGRMDPRQYGDGCLNAARYVGVVRAKKYADDGRTNLIQDDIRISGVGMNFWLGDEEGNGAVIEENTLFTSDTFSTVIDTLRPASVSNGTVYSVTGTYSGRHQYETARSAIQYVCQTMSVPGDPVTFRVNNDASLDAGHVSDLYVSEPTCVITRKNSISQGEDMYMRALPSTVDLDMDMEKFATRVVMIAESDSESLATGSADIDDISPGTNVYKDLLGNDLAITRLVSESETIEELADVRAELALRESIEPNKAFTISTEDYDIDGSFEVGDYIYIYDPDAGLVDTNNEIYIRGVRLNPVRLQVTEADWPITPGYTVAYRGHDGEWTDLTDYMHWEEEQPTQVVIGNLVRDLTESSNAVRDRVYDYQPIEGDGSTPGQVTLNTPFASSSYEDNTGNLKSLVVVDWDTPTNTDTSAITDGNLYEIAFKPASEPTSWETRTVGWGTNTLLLQGLLPDVSYNFRVRAVDKNANQGDWSSTHSQTTSSTPSVPAAPAAPSVSSDSAEDSTGVLKSFAQVTWVQPTNTDTTPIVDGQNYEVQYKLNTGSTWASQMVPFGTVTTQVANLNPGALYNFKVRAIDNAGNVGAFSTATNHTTAASASTPGAVTISSVNSDASEDTTGVLRATALVSWSTPTNTDSSSIIDGNYYEVQNKTAAASAWESRTVAFGTNSSAISGLLPDTAYNFRVRCVDQSGRVGAFGSTSNHTTAGSASVPAAPSMTPSGFSTSSYEIGGATRSRILATWSTPLNTNGTTVIDGGYYELQFKVDGQSNWETRQVTWGTNELLLSDLVPNVAYRFRIRAADNNGHVGAYSSEGTRTTGNTPTVPNTPVISIGATASYADTNGVARASQIITWTVPTNSDSSAITDGDRYELNLRRSGDTEWAVFNVAWGTNSYKFNDLSVGTQYNVRIRAIDRGNNMSSFSSASNFTTAEDTVAPSTPAAPTVAASLIAIQVTHTLGKSSGGTYNLETDLAHLEVHKGSTSGFTANSSSLVGYMSANAASLQAGVPVVKTFDVADTTAQWFKVIAVDHSGNKSNASTAASASATLIDSAHISDLTASKITAGTLSANVIVGANISTAVSGARVELTPSGLQSYDSGGNALVSIDSSTGLFTLKSASSGQRIELNSTGLVTYDPDGEVTSKLASDPTTTGDFISLRSSGGEATTVASINSVGEGAFSALTTDVLNVGGEDLNTILARLPKGILAHINLTSNSPAYISSSVEVKFGSIIIPNFDTTRHYGLGGSNIRFAKQEKNNINQLILRIFYKWDAPASSSDTQLAAWLINQYPTDMIDDSINFLHPFEFETAGGTDLHLAYYFEAGATQNQANGLRIEATSGSCLFVEDMGPRIEPGEFNMGTGGAGVQQYTKIYYPTWTGSYVDNNSRRIDNGDMYVGRYDGTYGNQNGLIGFPYSTIAADLSGATIDSISFTAYSEHWYNDTGGTLQIGTHNLTATSNSPSSYSDANITFDRVAGTGFPKPGKKTVALPTSWGAEFVAGTTRGIVLGPASATSKVYYGRLSGYPAINSHKPQLKIVFTK